jgi:hypothetical protein
VNTSHQLDLGLLIILRPSGFSDRVRIFCPLDVRGSHPLHVKIGRGCTYMMGAIQMTYRPVQFSVKEVINNIHEYIEV